MLTIIFANKEVVAILQAFLKTKKRRLNMDDFDKRDNEEIYSKKVRAGKRTYFFDVKSTKANDYFITITESKKRFEDGTFVKHKIFLYKEDFNKFTEAFVETINYVKTELMPEYNFDEFTREDYRSNNEGYKNENNNY